MKIAAGETRGYRKRHHPQPWKGWTTW